MEGLASSPQTVLAASRASVVVGEGQSYALADRLDVQPRLNPTGQLSVLTVSGMATAIAGAGLRVSGQGGEVPLESSMVERLVMVGSVPRLSTLKAE